jgi:Ca2+-binding RTX toxin-like protein
LRINQFRRPPIPHKNRGILKMKLGLGSFWENLESRRLLAFAELMQNGTLVVTGTAQSDVIAVSEVTGQIIVALGQQQLQFGSASVARLSVAAGAGDDVVLITASVPATIFGAEGNDRISGGPLNDSLDGGVGDDAINGEGGNDTMTGGDGTDVFDYADRSESFGFQIGYVSEINPGPFVAISNARHDELDKSTDYPEVIGGTEFDDGFVPIANASHPFPHAITILGRGGNDSCGGTNDLTPILAYGGAGRDSFGAYDGVSTPSTLLGGPGNDSFVQGNSGAIIDGGPGGDAFVSDSFHFAGSVDLHNFSSIENVLGAIGDVIGTDAPNYISFGDFTSQPSRLVSIISNGGNDTIIGSRFADYLSGGDGNDSIDGGGGNDVILGGIGNDMLIGNTGNDKIYGGAGNDTLLGGPGRDRLYGEAGDDLLSTRDKKRDTLYGGDGNDSGKIDNTATIKDLYHEIEKLV